MAVCLLLALFVFSGAAAFAAGLADLEIGSLDDLIAFRDAVNSGNTFAGKVVRLTASIDMGSQNWVPIGGYDAGKSFAGEFDGNGKTISNLKLSVGDRGDTKTRLGLFASPEKAYIHDFVISGVTISGTGTNFRAGALAGNVWEYTVVENVDIKNVSISVSGTTYVGALTGICRKSQVGGVDVSGVTITASGTSSDSSIGGMVGSVSGHIWDTGVTSANDHWIMAPVNGNVIHNLFKDCTVKNAKIEAEGTGVIGGFTGYNTYNNHSDYNINCSVTGLDIDCTKGSFTVGGYVGQKNGTTAADGYVDAGYGGCSVSGTIKGGAGVYGGFVGTAGGRAAEFENAVADVDIVCQGKAGGFVGQTANYYQHKQTFINCAAKGDVTGAGAVGGFVGDITLGGDGDHLNVEFVSCSASGDVNGEIAGGFAGRTWPELPANNWSIVEGKGSVVATLCSASGSVKGSEYAAGFIGLVQNVGLGDAKDGNWADIILSNITPSEKVGKNAAAGSDSIYNAAEKGFLPGEVTVSLYKAPKAIAALPKTGDCSSLILWSFLLALAVSGFVMNRRGRLN